MKTKAQTHLSHSQVQEFTQCPRRYHLHVRPGLLPEFMPSGLLLGSALHEALAAYHQGRLEGKELGLDDLCAAFLERWGKEQMPVEYGKGESEESLKVTVHGFCVRLAAGKVGAAR